MWELKSVLGPCRVYDRVEHLGDFYGNCGHNKRAHEVADERRKEETTKTKNADNQA